MLVTSSAPSALRKNVGLVAVTRLTLHDVWEDDAVLRTEAVVDLGAIRDNVARMKSGTSADLLAVVKADGYGHGLVPSARAAVDGGATWLGTAILDEAIALRAAGLTVPVLSWLWSPDEYES